MQKVEPRNAGLKPTSTGLGDRVSMSHECTIANEDISVSTVTRFNPGQTIYHLAGGLVQNLTFHLLDEAKRSLPIDNKLASHVKVSDTAAPSCCALTHQ